MPTDWPNAVAYDPQKKTALPISETAAAWPVILLAVGPQAQREGWAGRAAVALAESLGGRGSRVILADLSLDTPELHDLVSLDNPEGLTDVFLFGASLEHVIRIAPDRRFSLIPAAPFTPETADVLKHVRWSMVFEESATSQSQLLLYLPTNVHGAHALSDRVGRTIVLADPTEIDEVRAALSSDAEIAAVLSPPASVRAAGRRGAKAAPASGGVGAGRVADDDFEKIRVPKDSAREALIADLRARQRSAMTSPPPAKTTPQTETSKPKPAVLPSAGPARVVYPPPKPLTEPPPLQRKKRKRGGTRRVLVFLFLLLLLAGAAAGGWWIWQNRSDVLASVDRLTRRNAQTPRRPDAPTQGAPTQGAPTQGAPTPGRPDAPTQGGQAQNASPSATSPGAQGPARPADAVSLPRGRPLPYSVAIASYQVLDMAQDRVNSLRQSERGLSFYIVPVLVQGNLRYNVLAGPLPDSVSAAAMRDTLVARRIKTLSSGWDVLETRYAFLLGAYDSERAAQDRRAEIEAHGIPAYIVTVSEPQRPRAYRVYAGAHTGRGEADFMRQLLRNVGLPANLVERTGSSSS